MRVNGSDRWPLDVTFLRKLCSLGVSIDCKSSSSVIVVLFVSPGDDNTARFNSDMPSVGVLMGSVVVSVGEEAPVKDK